MSELMKAEDLRRVLTTLHGTGKWHEADLLQSHIAALEKERDEWFGRAMVAEAMRDLHREERDAAWSERASAIAEKHAALAANAKVVQHMENTVASLRKAVAEEKARKRPSQARVMEWMHALVLFEQHINMADGSPGAALLEEHRNALENAIAKEREYRDQRIKEEQAAEARALDTIRTAMAELGEKCREGGLIGIMNGMERIQVRARNEGLEHAARIAKSADLPLVAFRIRAMKGPEE